MTVRPGRNALIEQFLADLLPRHETLDPRGNSPIAKIGLEILGGGAMRRTAAHVDLKVRTAKNLEEVATEGHVVGHGFWALCAVDELCGLTGPAI